MALYDPQKHNPHASRTAQDPGVSGLTYLAWALWFLSYPEQAMKKAPEAFALAQELSHSFSSAWAVNLATKVQLWRREGPAVQEQAEVMLRIATEQDMPYWLAQGTMLRGWALAEQGQEEEGIVQMHQGFTAWRAMGTRVAASYFLALPVEAYRRMGQVEKGQKALTEALTLVDNTGEHFYEAELYRLKGELTLQSKVQGPKSEVINSPGSEVRSPESEAEECYLQALGISRKQQAKSLELRATMSLARLWQQQGKHHKAHRMLSDIYNWFTEGFDTKDLQEAKALLESLESSV